MNYLIYQAYGSKEIIDQAKNSLLSYFDKAQNAARIVIYTDNVFEFQRFMGKKRVIYRELNKELIHEWKGEINFVHRVKIKILQDFFLNHPAASALYVDSDTTFMRDPEILFDAISENLFVMHIQEGIVKDKSNPIFKKLYKYLISNEISLPGENKIRIPVSTAMWNAGVIGIKGSQKYILDKVLAFTDSMYPHFPKHIVEQFAFSYYLQNEGKIVPAFFIIDHYWDSKQSKDIVKLCAPKLNEKDIDYLVGLLHALDQELLVMPRLQPRKHSRAGRFIRKMLGREVKEKPGFDIRDN